MIPRQQPSPVCSQAQPTRNAQDRASRTPAHTRPAASTRCGPSAAAAHAPGSSAQVRAAYPRGGTTGTKPDLTVTVPLAASPGGARSMDIDFRKSAANPNQWYAEARVVPATT